MEDLNFRIVLHLPVSNHRLGDDSKSGNIRRGDYFKGESYLYYSEI